jgi:hypothetical protein
VLYYKDVAVLKFQCCALRGCQQFGAEGVSGMNLSVDGEWQNAHFPDYSLANVRLHAAAPARG